MAMEYRQLLLVYVPASCTSAMQMSDAMYNRPLKPAFSQNDRHSIVSAVECQLNMEVDPEAVDFKDVVGGVSNLVPNVLELSLIHI